MQTTNREVEFFFRKPSDKAILEAKTENKPLPIKKKAVKLPVPVLTLEGISAIVAAKGDDTTPEGQNANKQKDLLLEAVNEYIIMGVKRQIDEQPAHTEVDTTALDMSKVSWEALANMPKSERTGGGIAKEVWEAFQKDYEQVMPAATGKSIEKVKNAAKLLVAKFQPCKGQKKLIQALKDMLDIWYASTSSAEEFTAVYEFLAQKAEALVQADEDALVENLI